MTPKTFLTILEEGHHTVLQLPTWENFSRELRAVVVLVVRYWFLVFQKNFTLRADMNASDDLLGYVDKRKFPTVLADPQWQFQNRTGKMAPEHKRLSRYPTMTLQEIKDLPVEAIVEDTAHLYLWVPNALLAYGQKRWRTRQAGCWFLL